MDELEPEMEKTYNAQMEALIEQSRVILRRAVLLNSTVEKGNTFKATPVLELLKKDIEDLENLLYPKGQQKLGEE